MRWERDNRASKTQNRSPEAEGRGTALGPPTASFDLQVSSSRLLLSLLLFLILANIACNRNQPKPLREPERRDLATRFRAVVKDAGGTQIWIKRPTKAHHERSPEPSLQVVATPAGYRAVISALRRESENDRVEFKSTTVSLRGGRHLLLLNVSQRGQTVLHIQMREVPRLLRAAIVIDDMGRDLDAAQQAPGARLSPDLFGVALSALQPRDRAGSTPQRA